MTALPSMKAVVSGPTRGYKVTVTMTAGQAVAAEHALARMAVVDEDPRLFSAATRVRSGLYDAGWDTRNTGSEDEPVWIWEHAS